MNYLTQRALYYTFATQAIENGNAIKDWRQIAELFDVPGYERQSAEKLLSDPMLARLKTIEDVRLLQKCGEGFGNVFKLSPDDEEVLELKYQALLKLKQLTGEYRMTPLKAIASVYRQDSVAAVLYALQIFMNNKRRSALGCEILSEALTLEENSDAGILLLHVKHDDKGTIYGKLAETPDMILHPDILEALAKVHGINPVTTRGDSTRIGF